MEKKGREVDWADEKAEELFELVRNAEDDQKVIDAIAQALRDVWNRADRHPLDM